MVFIGPFGLQPKGTMSVRALPLARALVRRGHMVTMLIPPWDNARDAGKCWEDGGVRIENMALPPSIPVLSHILLSARLANRALSLRPDMVHFFKPKSYAGLAHLFLWWLRRLKRTTAGFVVDAS